MAQRYATAAEQEALRQPREPVRHGFTPAEDEYGEPHGYGWVLFAAIMIMIAATLNVIYGIAAISNSHFYTGSVHFVISDLKTWGWVVLLVGVAEYCVALGILVKAGWARWTGVAAASINAIVQLVFLPAAPLLSLTVFTLDVLVVYGLVAYGGRLEGA